MCSGSHCWLLSVGSYSHFRDLTKKIARRAYKKNGRQKAARKSEKVKPVLRFIQKNFRHSLTSFRFRFGDFLHRIGKIFACLRHGVASPYQYISVSVLVVCDICSVAVFFNRYNKFLFQLSVVMEIGSEPDSSSGLSSLPDSIVIYENYFIRFAFLIASLALS